MAIDETYSAREYVDECRRAWELACSDVERLEARLSAAREWVGETWDSLVQARATYDALRSKPS